MYVYDIVCKLYLLPLLHSLHIYFMVAYFLKLQTKFVFSVGWGDALWSPKRTSDVINASFLGQITRKVKFRNYTDGSLLQNFSWSKP